MDEDKRELWDSIVADLEAEERYSRLNDADVPYEAKRYYCTVCHQNEVNALDGYDTCEECLARM